MKLAHEFEVAAPVETVWDLLLDLERVAPCLPGGEVTGKIDDTRYNVMVKIKLGPLALTYRGEISIVETDKDARKVVMEGKASESHGQGTARATISTLLESRAGLTHAQVETDLHLTGRVAQMGRGIVEEVSGRMIGEFARCLSATAAAANTRAGDAAPILEPPPRARPVSMLQLLRATLRSLSRSLVNSLRRRRKGD